MLTGADMFERHLDLVGQHFRFATLDEIGEHLATGEPFTERVAAVTFDDGYRDNYEHAFPILQRKGDPGGGLCRDRSRRHSRPGRSTTSCFT